MPRQRYYDLDWSPDKVFFITIRSHFLFFSWLFSFSFFSAMDNYLFYEGLFLYFRYYRLDFIVKNEFQFNGIYHSFPLHSQ